MFLWRVWRVSPEGRLSSLFVFDANDFDRDENGSSIILPKGMEARKLPWEADVTEARCLPPFRQFVPSADKGPEDPPCMRPPTRRCGCGIHGYRTIDDLRRGREPITQQHVYGVVEVGGKTWEHEFGARAEMARPVAVVTMRDGLASAIERTHGCHAYDAEGVYEAIRERELLRDEDSPMARAFARARYPASIRNKEEAWRLLAAAVEVYIADMLGESL